MIFNRYHVGYENGVRDAIKEIESFRTWAAPPSWRIAEHVTEKLLDQDLWLLDGRPKWRWSSHAWFYIGVVVGMLLGAWLMNGGPA